jgi:hypothetical protein
MAYFFTEGTALGILAHLHDMSFGGSHRDEVQNGMGCHFLDDRHDRDRRGGRKERAYEP